ncbi:MAG: hypothetical protein M0Z30_07630 [Actinomycetota bacterium]|nr:hypothetical protein [Actinomycetota bacterium]
MPVRSKVRAAQQAIAAYDAAHARASARLDQAIARRSEVLAEADRQVEVARAGVEQAVAAMARGVSVELTAQLLGLDPAEIRRLTKTCPEAPLSPERAGGKASSNGTVR